MANNMASNIEEQLFEDIENKQNEINKALLDYETRHNRLLEVYNQNVKILNLQKKNGRITITELCIYLKNIQEQFIIELSNIHSSITPLINEQIYQKQMCDSFNDDIEIENDLFYEKKQLSEQLVGVTGGCYYNM